MKLRAAVSIAASFSEPDALDMETQRRLRGRHFGVIGMEERAKIIGAAI